MKRRWSSPLNQKLPDFCSQKLKRVLKGTDYLLPLSYKQEHLWAPVTACMPLLRNLIFLPDFSVVPQGVTYFCPHFVHPPVCTVQWDDSRVVYSTQKGNSFFFIIVHSFQFTSSIRHLKLEVGLDVCSRLEPRAAVSWSIDRAFETPGWFIPRCTLKEEVQKLRFFQHDDSN